LLNFRCIKRTKVHTYWAIATNPEPEQALQEIFPTVQRGLLSGDNRTIGERKLFLGSWVENREVDV
jgi:hypothetical protein